jgi:hypothetical protein
MPLTSLRIDRASAEFSPRRLAACRMYFSASTKHTSGTVEPRNVLISRSCITGIPKVFGSKPKALLVSFTLFSPEMSA